jgi:galactose mutarotase-like enzyme
MSGVILTVPTLRTLSTDMNGFPTGNSEILFNATSTNQTVFDLQTVPVGYLNHTLNATDVPMNKLGKIETKLYSPLRNYTIIVAQDGGAYPYVGLQMRDKSFTIQPLMGAANTFNNKWSGMHMLTQEPKSEIETIIAVKVD